MNELLNKIIRKIELDADAQHFIKFTTNEGEVTYIAYGDCCSESWFADIIGVDSLLNSKIHTVEELQLPNYNLDDGRRRQEEDEVYGYKLTTNKGSCDIIFRNSSNGYYGGWLTVAEDSWFETKDAKNINWREIIQDYPN